MFFYINWTYILMVLPAFIFASWASSKVNSTFNMYSNEYSRSGKTGADVARRVLDEHGLTHIRIERVSGKLTDHYDPKNNVIRLSSSVYDSTSVAAIGVACHEVGHAIQYKEGYFPIKLRNAIIPLINFSSRLAMPLILIGILLSSLGEGYSIVAYIGVALFGVAVLFQLITLPVEYNASNRAIKQLDNSYILDSYELDGAKKVLNAAALTYVASLAIALSQFMYLLRLVGRRNRR
ncbi:MAG: zinc metallopeptidase [Bacilli bacterium]|nr:zinc metallopeptidase [Bacilli bacterium]